MSPPPGRRPPVRVDPFPERARGTLLGLAVGDALGAPLDGRRFRADPFPTLMTAPYREMSGGGPLSLKPGQVTDGTQMACCLAMSLRELQRYDAEDVRKRYLAWLPLGLAVDVPTKEVLTSELPVHLAARNLWHASSRRAAGNASLLRTAPLAVFFPRDAKSRMQASFEDSRLTHFDPRCQLACAALNGALALAMTSERVTPEQMVKAAESTLVTGAPTLARELPDFLWEVQAAGEALRADLTAARAADPELYGPDLHLHKQEGFVRVAFRLAFWELLHAGSFEAALLDVINRGGDASTHAAITGALFGALGGEGAIPSAWRATVLTALEYARGPLRAVYHPVELLLLAPS